MKPFSGRKSLEGTIMKKLVSHLLAQVSITCFILLGVGTAFAQPLPPPDGGGGSYTNTPFTNYYSNAPLPPGLKFGTPVIESTNFRLTLLEADPEGQYDLYFATNAYGPVWSNILQGVAGQTNFLVSKPEPDGGFFRAARADAAVEDAGGTSFYFLSGSVNTNIISTMVAGGPAAATAILVDSTNFAGAVWIPFTSMPLVDIGTNEGMHEVWFGFKGTNGIAYWTMDTITVDKTPPLIVITNPVFSATFKPIIQVQGYSAEPLSSICFDVTNAAGSLTNQQGFVTAQSFDTNLFAATTNYFQCFDVPLTNGMNAIFVHATDLAGNVATANVSITLDFLGDTNPPTLQIVWPHSGDSIGGSVFTLRGICDDETAQVFARILETNGATNSVEGIVERNGKFWLEDLPLNPGANVVTVTATDVAGNSVITNLTLTRSVVAITIDTVADDQLNLPTTTVIGNVSDSSYAVWVNGVQAAVDGSGDWSADNVPVYENETAVFDAIAYPSGSTNSFTPVLQSLAQEQPPILYVYHHENDWSQQFLEYGQFFHIHKTYDEDFDANGHRFFIGKYTSVGQDGDDGYAWWDWRFEWSDTNAIGIETYERGLTGDDYYDPQYYQSGSRPGPPGNEFIMSIPATSLVSDYVHGNPPIRHYYANVHANGYKQISRTYMKLKTGGRSGIGRKNLFTIAASALEYGRNENVDWDGERDYWDSTPASAIAPTRIRVMGKWVGNDGKLFAVLPDNATIDLQASAPARHYNLNLSATKHRLHILANGTALAKDRVRPGANFCVGQKISLESLMTPPVGQFVQDHGPEWLAAGTFCNYVENWPHDAKKYLIDWQLTYQTNSHLWWLNSGPKGVACVWNMTFTNGQTVSVKEFGKTFVHTPKFIRLESTAPYFPWISRDLTTAGKPWLQLGGEVATEGGSMNFLAYVVSDYGGTIRWTQLINQYRYRDDGPTGSWTESTDGKFEVDAGEFYVPQTCSTDLTPGQTNWLSFADGPGNPVGYSLAESHDIFKTYLRFRPNGDDSIWVTLGRVDWSWQATASCPTGSPLSWENWSITSSNITGPVYFDDTTIPFWTDKTLSIPNILPF